MSTLRNNPLAKAIRFALVGGAAVAAISPVLAADEEGKEEEQRIEVTGSRIKRTDVETSQPVFSLNREEIKAQGMTSIGDVIQNLSANGSTLNSTFNNGGNGETRVSLRNLGSDRTLVLVNGQRWVGGTGLGGAVDLNTIPTAAVERIEVLKAGAAATYGSDAIAGVVNIILRKDFEGAEFNVFGGKYVSEGDGKKESYDLTFGASNNGINLLFGAAYVKEEPVWAGDRDVSAEPIYHTGVAFGSSTTPAGRFALCAAPFTINPVTGVCSGGETRPNGTAGQFTYDEGQSGLNWRNRTGADLYNFAPDNYLITPQERKSIFSRATIDLTDDISASMMATYNNRKSEQLLAAMPIVLGSGPGAGVQARTVHISEDSMYNPFGEPVSRIQRRAVETGGRSFRQDVDTFAFSAGVEGSFELADRSFSWDVGSIYARNDQNDTTDGLFNILALTNALGPSEVRGGVPVCVDALGGNIIAGCVPLNLLGAPGTITQDMLGYSSFVAHDEFGFKMRHDHAYLSGDLFELPGGMMAFSAGLERREESGFDQPDALINSGNTTGNARTVTKGHYDLDEAFLELNLPLLQGLPGAETLELTLATRSSDYSNFGSTTNSTYGFKWRPIAELMIRGNYAEGFRAPSISDLFQGVSDSFPQIADPCSTTFGGGYNGLDATQQARCHAQGVPVGGYDQGNAQIRISTGGNPDLQPEESITQTAGIVWSPSYVEGFDVSLDWWRIELTDAITTFSGQKILDDCIKSGFTAACDLYSRNSSGAVDSLLSAGLNVSKQNVEGWDLTINYRLPETAFGQFTVSWDSTYLSLNEFDNDSDGDIDAADGGSDVGDYQDRNNNWRLRSNIMVRWEMGDIGATLFTRYYSEQEEDCPFYYNDYGFGELCNDATVDGNGVVQPGSKNTLAATFYHDASFYWNAPWNARVTLGVNNLLDEEPPVSFTTFANSFDPQYDIQGRFVYLQYNQKF